VSQGVCDELSCGALLVGLLVSRRPSVRQELVEPAVGPGVDARQDVGDVAAGIDASGVGGGDQRQLVGKARSTGRGACKQPRLAPGSHWPEATFSGAVVDVEAAVEREGDQELVPLVDQVGDALL